MHILKVVFILLEVVLLFNLLIFVHELGHFLAARWRGLKIERFAVWFGKPIWRKRIGDVEYALGSIPAGGYVSLPQMAPMDIIEGKTANREELPPISSLDKIIVAFAGPLFSFLLALAFGVVVWVIGRPVSETETKTVIGYVMKDSPAEAAGLVAGDKILSIDGKPVKKFGGIGDTVMWRVVRSEGDTIPVTVLRDGQEKTFTVRPIKDKTGTFERKALREIQVLPIQTPIVAKVAEDSPAAKAGLKPNDIIVAANGNRLYHPGAVSDIIRAAPDAPVTLQVQRSNTTFEKSIKPVMPAGLIEDKTIPDDEKYPMIGITWEHGGRMDLDHPDPISQVTASVSGMINTLGAILSPKSDIKFQHLSGPVGIIRIYYRLFESEQGWRLAIWFSVVLNVNLALLNLLPIPVLDGGHITLALIEGVRRKPVNVRLINAVQTVCAVLLIGYLVYITFYDAQDLRGGAKERKEIRFTPEKEKR
jgi:regulator of sigma E protease